MAGEMDDGVIVPNQTIKYLDLEQLTNYHDRIMAKFESSLEEAKKYTNDEISGLASESSVAERIANHKELIDALDVEVEQKADATHTHEIENITGLIDRLNTVDDLIATKQYKLSSTSDNIVGFNENGSVTYKKRIGRDSAGSNAEVFNDYENNEASGNYSHAEGYGTIASGGASHAEGQSTFTSGSYSHAEGYGTTASGAASHAEGRNSVANGTASHAEGRDTVASGNYSHAEGYGTKATTRSVNVIGEYNKYEDGEAKVIEESSSLSTLAAANIYIGSNYTFDNSYIYLVNQITGTAGDVEVGDYIFQNLDDDYKTQFNYVHRIDSISHRVQFGMEYCDFTTTKCTITKISNQKDYLHIVGNGSSDTSRSNAHTLDWDGNAWFAGDVYVGGDEDENGNITNTNSKKLATEEFAIGEANTVKTDLLNGVSEDYNTLNKIVGLINANKEANAEDFITVNEAIEDISTLIVDNEEANAEAFEAINVTLENINDTIDNLDYDAGGTANTAVENHDASSSAHSDIRSAISNLIHIGIDTPTTGAVLWVNPNTGLKYWDASANNRAGDWVLVPVAFI